MLTQHIWSLEFLRRTSILFFFYPCRTWRSHWSLKQTCVLFLFLFFGAKTTTKLQPGHLLWNRNGLSSRRFILHRNGSSATRWGLKKKRICHCLLCRMCYLFIYCYLMCWLIPIIKGKNAMQAFKSWKNVSSLVLRSPSGIAQACIAQSTRPLRNTFQEEQAQWLASFLLSRHIWQSRNAAAAAASSRQQIRPKSARLRGRGNA